MPLKLGTILSDNQLLSYSDIEKALEYQKKTGYSFGECLLKLNLCTNEELLFGITRQIELKNKFNKKGLYVKELATLLKRLATFKLLFFIIIFLVLSVLFLLLHFL